MKETESSVVCNQATKHALWKRKAFWLILGAGILLVILAVICVFLIFNNRTDFTPVNVSSILESQASQTESSVFEPTSSESLVSSKPAMSSSVSSTPPVSSTASVVAAPSFPPPANTSSVVSQESAFPLPDTEPLVKTPVDAFTEFPMFDSSDVEGFIACIDNWLYFRSSDSRLCRMRLDGSERQDIADHISFIHPVEKDGFIYYVKDEYTDGAYTQQGIGMINLSDLSQTYLDTSPDVNTLQIENGWIFYICDRSQTRTDGSLYAMRTDGSHHQKVSDQCVSFVQDGTRVFFTEGDSSVEKQMLYCNLDKGTRYTLRLEGIDPTPCLIEGGYLYFTMEHKTDIEFNGRKCFNTSLYRLKLEDFTMKKIVEYQGVNSIYDLIMQDGWLYFDREIGPNYHSATYTYYRCRPDGSDNTFLFQSNLRRRVRIDGELLYYLSHDDTDQNGRHMVLRVLALDGSRYETLYSCDLDDNRINDFFIAEDKLYLVCSNVF